MVAFKFKLTPTLEQQEKIFDTLNLCCSLYNAGLEQRITVYKKTGKKPIVLCIKERASRPEKNVARIQRRPFTGFAKCIRKARQSLRKSNGSCQRKKRGSNRHKKAVHQLAKLHEQIANKRKDTAHQISRKLVNTHDLLVFEDLEVQKMVQESSFCEEHR